jgi:exodeoxyribonuclease VII small subunit
MARKEGSYKENLDSLKKVVEELEDGDLAIEDALKKYEKGVEASKRCRKLLAEAERKIEMLSKDEATGEIKAEDVTDSLDADE